MSFCHQSTLSCRQSDTFKAKVKINLTFDFKILVCLLFLDHKPSKFLVWQTKSFTA